MLWIYQGYGVSDILLQEVGTKWTVDPVLFCYGIYVLVAFLVCTVAYLVLAWHGRRTERLSYSRPYQRRVSSLFQKIRSGTHTGKKHTLVKPRQMSPRL
ncbi:MAG: hypothetical protein ACN4G0_06055 [Polyangiales bacterium]